MLHELSQSALYLQVVYQDCLILGVGSPLYLLYVQEPCLCSVETQMQAEGSCSEERGDRQFYMQQFCYQS